MSSSSPELLSELIAAVSALVNQATGVQFGPKQRTMVENRLKRRMLDLRIDAAGYAERLKSHPTEEQKALISLLTTHHTFFFREFAHFEFIEKVALPELIELKRKTNDRVIRIWSAACSRGHEVYSLAMFLSEVLPRLAPEFTFEILGTDVDPESVAFAANGIYEAKEIKEIPMQYLRDCWSQGTGDIANFYRAKKAIKDRCTFKVLNLITAKLPEHGAKFDLILCRNVFIYFSADQIASTTRNLLQQLGEDGYLFVGLSESLHGTGIPVSALGPSVYVHKSKQARATAPAAKAETPARCLNVLCVDDSPSILKILQRILTVEHGFKVVGTATNGFEAAKKVSELKPDLVTLDIHMPEQDGVAYLKSVGGKPHPPVIMVTSVEREQVALAQKCIELGAKDYIEKPSMTDFTERSDEIRVKIRCVLAATAAKPAPKAAPAQKTETKPAPQPARAPAAPAKARENANLSSGVFISVYDSKKGRGHSWIAEDRELEESRMREQLESARAALGGSDLASCDLKIVGLKKNVDRATAAIKKRSLTPRSVSTRENGHAEIRFDPKSGRLLVAWSSAPAAAAHAAPTAQLEKTRVLVVDDSATIRKVLTSLFQSAPGFEVVGCAETPSQVEGLIAKTKPNVITLDIHLPEMDGVTLLKKIYPKYRIPTVMITSVAKEDGTYVIDALESGAVDYIQKPSLADLRDVGPAILERVRLASLVRKSQRARPTPGRVTGKFNDTETVIAIGSSTGGTEALKDILIRLPEDIPPIVIVQHIPAMFSEALAKRLDSLCPFEVKEARDGDLVRPNSVLIAPGGKQMRVERSPQGLKVVVFDGAPVNRHKPSVDVLFDSVAKVLGSAALGVILTGMGADGAKGLLQMKNAGARTIAQDEESSVVFGMPKEAIRLGAADQICSLNDIPAQLMKLLSFKMAA